MGYDECSLFTEWLFIYGTKDLFKAEFSQIFYIPPLVLEYTNLFRKITP